MDVIMINRNKGKKALLCFSPYRKIDNIKEGQIVKGLTSKQANDLITRGMALSVKKDSKGGKI